MYRIQSKDALIDYVKRALGAPMVEVNIEDDQMDDRIHDALDMFMDFHSEGTTLTYYKHLITQADVDNDYITTPDNILYVTKMFETSNMMSGMYGEFGGELEMMLDQVSMMRGQTGQGGNLAQWHQQGQYMELINMTFRAAPQITFSTTQNRLYVHGDQLGNKFKVGQYAVFEVYVVVDPEEFGDVYNNRYVKMLSVQFAKRQWGVNLMKFDGMQLPGGVTLNGRQFYDDATSEIERIEDKLRLEYEVPPMFFLG